ncbi:MAG: VCBS repeat-containing protein, partial [Verrucomicrobiales bacterium]
MKAKTHPHPSQSKKRLPLLNLGATFLLAISPLISNAQISPAEGTLAEHAIVIEATGGEQLTRATAAGGTGPVLTQDFDTAVSIAGSHELSAGQIKLSSGRHLVMYDTLFDATGGSNRAEIQSAINLAGTRLVAGRSQGYVRRTGGANEAVLSGGAIITVETSGDVLTLESWRTDTNTNAAVVPTRVANGSAVQLLRLDDTWDFLSLERATNQAGIINTTSVDVAYDTNVSPGTMGSAFSAAGGNITLNEAGLYLVFANTSIQKSTNNTRTNYQQRLTLDGSPVASSTTTTYVRGNEDSNEGMTSLGMVLSATAGQVLNVEVAMEAGGNQTGLIQGGETAITMVKLPATSEYISLLDTTNQEVNDASLDPVVYNTQVDASSSKFSHTVGGSTVTVNEDSDYLFFGSVFTQSDTTNDNQDRTIPLHGWQIDGSGGNINYGRGAQYNRDNGGDRTSGSWGAAIISLTDTQTVQLTTQRIGNVDVGMATSIAGLQGLSITSLLPSNDPLIVKNVQLSVLVSSTGTITDSLLLISDADDAPADLTYTVTSAPTLGTLKNGVATIGNGGTFTQADVNSGAVTFEAGAATGTGGFNFSVADDSGSGNIATGTFVIGIGVATMLVDDTTTTDEDSPLTAPAPGVLLNDSGTDLTVTNFDATSPMGAAVTVASDGTLTYDPTAAAALQALDDTESVVDTFTYTVTDFSSTNTVANISVTVNGVNDAPVVISDTGTGSDSVGPSLNVLANDSDVDTNDSLTVTSIDGNPFGTTGLTILSGEEASITITPDGSFSYDPSTSADISSLGTGDVLTETIAYEVSDGTVTVAGTITITSIGTPGTSNDIGFLAANGTGNIDILSNDELFGAAATPTAGAVTDFNAADAGNTDTTWNNNGTAAAGVDITLEGPGTQSVLNTSPSGAPVGVTASYDLSGTGSGSVINSTDSLPNIYGTNISTTNATIEMVFRPDDLSGPEPLWGTGGNGTGASLVLLDDQLIFTAGQGAIVLQVSGPIAGTDFVHVLVTIDLSTDTAELYINNVLVDTSTSINITSGAAADITDWSGTDSEGVGRSNGTTGGDVNVAPFLGAFGTIDIPDFNEPNDRFDGDLAVLRIYSGTILDATARGDNFAAVFGASSVPVVGDIVNLAGETALVPGTTIVSLPSGATVKLESNGTLTYDPNGAFDHISSGVEVTDSFTYMLGGGNPATSTVTARIFGSNNDPPITIAADQSNVTEGAPAGFTLTAASAVTSNVTVNLTYTGTASDGIDYTSQASIDITSGNTTADLDLATIIDSLFENSSETITVIIDNVTGPGSLGTSTSAATILDDGDAAPEFTITGGGSVTEGSAASFIVSSSVAANAPITVDIAYTGTATSSDFSPVTQVTMLPNATAATISLLAFDDGIVDAGETIIATASNPSLGGIGTPDNATATISDGSGMAVFFANFEGVDPADTPGGTLLDTDAPSAANLGTGIGHWANVLTASTGGAAPGLILEVDDVRGDGLDTMLRLDRPGTDAAGELCAVFDGAIDIS